MNLLQFSTQVGDQLPVANYNSFIFVGEQEYPLLFLSSFFSWLQAREQAAVQTIDLSSASHASVRSSLEMSFLGMRSMYWLQGMHDLDLQKQDQWVEYLHHYQGPNTIICFFKRAELALKNNKALVIELPTEIGHKQFLALVKFSGKQLSRSGEQTAQEIFERVGTLTLDTASLLIHYTLLVGSGGKEFLDQWLTSLVMPERSLFTLARYFFAKEPAAFFRQWQRLSDAYSPAFWTMFWAEQLWRAYYVVQFSQQNRVSEAKAIGYRLPFTLMQRDWRKHSPDALLKAHQRMYELDYLLKNGGDPFLLEAFFGAFLSQ